MISVLFTILKIIGFILLFVLGLLILIVCLVLLDPVSYEIGGKIDNIEADIKCRISWLFRIIQFVVIWNMEEQSSQVRIFGIPLKSRHAEDEDAQAADEESETGNSEAHENSAEDTSDESSNVDEAEEESDVENSEENSVGKTTEEDSDFGNLEKGPIIESPDAEGFAERAAGNAEEHELEDKANTEQSSNTENRKKRSPYGIAERWNAFRDSGKDISNAWKDTRNRSAILHIWKEMTELLKHTSPKKARADIDFGTPDPCWTGLVTGGIAMIPWIYGRDMHIIPDFESERFYVKGEFQIGGHIRLVHLLMAGIRLWRDKNITRLRHRLGH